MSYCKEYGKDKVIFATKEDHAVPSSIELPETENQPGLILENGDINWNCPCLGGMATGPCGVEFRDAFSCFHYSTDEPKGKDCYDAFSTMQNCMANYPGVYKQDRAVDDIESEEKLKALEDNDEDYEDEDDDDDDTKELPKEEQKVVQVKS